MKKIIIDCDPGIDDAFAIACAHKDKDTEILAIHTVAGNVTIDLTTKNAQALSYVLGYSGPIHRGADCPLVYELFNAAEVHGHNGFGGVQSVNVMPLAQESALSSALKLLKEHENITYVALGPLTNLALLIKAYPNVASKIDCIALMGGGLKGGNTTIAGEFNFYVDPHAAHIVFNSGIPIIMAGLDVTEQGYITGKDIRCIRDKGGALGQFLYDISHISFHFAREVLHRDDIHLHDVMAFLAISHPEIFTMIDTHISIATDNGLTRGMSIADTRPRSTMRPNAKVIIGVDQQRFQALILGYLTKEGL